MATVKSKSGIGFDLGTTYSAVAASKEGQAQVISNPEGTKTTPSVVAFLKDEKVVGSQAIVQAQSSPGNVIFDAKRLMGKKFDEESVEQDKQKWPFKVIRGEGGRVIISYPIEGGEDKEVSPEQVGATILRKLKEYAEGYLDHEVTDCVITCPASFNDNQRKATMNAAKIAGLNCLRLVNEPTAAAVAYGVSKDHEGEVLVFDLGGGTFDATVLSIKNGAYEVKASGGDPHCGGKDLDNLVVEHVMKQFNKNRTSGSIDIKDEAHVESLKKLLKEVEVAKIALTGLPETQIFVGSFVQGANGKYVDLSMKLTRTTLQKIAKPLVARTIKMTEDLLKKEGIKKTEIDKIVCVGGFTKMPFVREELKKCFGEEKVSLGVNPDEAVALGASIMAEFLSGENPDGKGLPTLIVDVTPLALGIQLENGTMSKIIESNTPIPTRQEDNYSTSVDGQTAVKITVVQGNRPFAKDNKKLGEFKLEGIPAMEKGKPDIRVSFQITADGILTVTAHEKSTGENQLLTISKDMVGGLTQQEVDNMVADEAKFAEFDRLRKEKIQEREHLERWIDDNEESSAGNREFSLKVKEVSEWLDNDDEKRTEDFREKKKILEDLLSEKME